ncbi:hypothetical protein DK847_14645 [Aestuariivirga litoralis]|uniref:Helix-turn-helix domain-containing protein n=1 Tax=Aestuariivirga litoralis TaxID=2650924 RepID=A0A2W2AUW6_9HYPH|nr:hypothetical protein [Aestuariivirga litoralis]PZF76410.1 hypothetical protein DK847_14645 [Aestuariivirga litoralis]
MSDTFTKDRLQWLDAICAHADLDGAAFKLAYRISGHINRRTGDAWPSLGHLANVMGMNERSVRRRVDALVVRGFLSKTRGGDGRPNRYRMLLSDRTPMSEQDEGRPDTDVHSDISDRTFETARPDIPVTQTGHQCPPNSLKNSLKEPSEEEYISPTAPVNVTDDFEEIWTHYPRKVSKGRASSAYKAALKRADVLTIKAGVLRYAAERSGQDHKFTKHLASWLNGDCWLDEPSPPPTTTASRGPSWQSGKERTLAALRIVSGDNT